MAYQPDPARRYLAPGQRQTEHAAPTEAAQRHWQLAHLNQQLEAHVQARTQELAQAQAQAETDSQRLRLQQLVAPAPALIASLRGPTHVVELANDGFRAIFGGRDLVGKPYRAAIPEFEGQPFFDLLDAVYRTGETYYGREEPVVLDRTNSGQLTPAFITYTYQATRDAEGRVEGILVFCYEVTEQVLARREREDAGRQLARVFEQAPVAVAVLQGPDYRIEVANARVAELWGRPPTQVLGRPLFEALPEVRGQGFRELLDQVVATGEAFVAQEVSATWRAPTSYSLPAFSPSPSRQLRCGKLCTRTLRRCSLLKPGIAFGEELRPLAASAPLGAQR